MTAFESRCEALGDPSSSRNEHPSPDAWSLLLRKEATKIFSNHSRNIPWRSAFVTNYTMIELFIMLSVRNLLASTIWKAIHINSRCLQRQNGSIISISSFSRTDFSAGYPYIMHVWGTYERGHFYPRAVAVNFSPPIERLQCRYSIHVDHLGTPVIKCESEKSRNEAVGKTISCIQRSPNGRPHILIHHYTLSSKVWELHSCQQVKRWS